MKRNMVHVGVSEGKEDKIFEKPLIPTLSYEISQVEEKITDFYKTGAQNTPYIEQNVKTVCKYLTRFLTERVLRTE